ncbi:MAG: peptidoglycan DD-metalloendopeptidase family protein [Synechococcales cyanobacterium RM1_1_8]|nr:peptidoglycan DD-metalloendopeptidase family protein [Synechococcales cyanobacterium RM1_1_8]
MQSLAAANGISDPDLIFVGQNLRLPSGANIAPANIASATGQPGANQVQVANPVVASAPAPISPAPASPAPVAQADGSVDYVDSLLDEIRSLRQKYRSEAQANLAAAPKASAPEASAATQAAATQTAATQAAATQAAATEATVAVQPAPRPAAAARPLAAPLPPRTVSPAAGLASPQSAPAPSVAVLPGGGGPIKVTRPLTERVAQGEPQLFAAASLGSDAYEPLAQSLLRQSVAPGLPPLSSEPYLPDQASTGFIWPAQGILTSGYGWRWGRMHKGIDIAADTGTPIVAAASGTVTYSGWADGYGNLVEITHPNGTVTLYGHNNRNVVREGDRVRQGQHIADMGSTGRSTGPHVHFEIIPSGQGAVNPAAFLPPR